MTDKLISAVRNWQVVCLLLLACGTRATPCLAAWTSVGDGISYQKFTLSDPNNVFVARMQRSSLSATMDTATPYGQLTGGRERVTAMASRLNGSLSYWGQEWGATSNVVVAVNGDFFNTTTGVPWGGLFQSGWYASHIPVEFGGAQLSWTMNRVAFISNCVETAQHALKIGFGDSAAPLIADGVNSARGSDSLVIYTPQWAASTGTDDSGSEVLVQMTRPLLALTPAESVVGYVRQIRQGQGSTVIPFDHVVLSAHGTAAADLLSRARPGAAVTVSVQVTTRDGVCQMPLSGKWKNTFASIHGNAVMLNNGVLPGEWDTNRHPRTAVAYDESYVYFVVCDGRSGVSRGMTGAELATFCRNTLGAKWGVNLDGGGSSVMVVNGGIVNSPSDGSERAVGNALAMVSVRPQTRSGAFCAGQSVSVPQLAECYLGPGNNYAPTTPLPAGTIGQILDHVLNGVYAKGRNWWSVASGSVRGWVAEASLLPHQGQQVTILSGPLGQTACAGSEARLSIEARGSGCLAYRWSKDGEDLEDDGRRLGSTTPTLTITQLVAGDSGHYRCRVAGSGAPVLSEAAQLSVRLPVSAAFGAPSPAATRSGPVSWSVVYTGAEAVSLAPSDVALSRTGTASAATVEILGSGLMSRTIRLSGLTGEGTLSVSLVAATALGCTPAPAIGPSGAVVVDATPPGGVIVTDEGFWTPSASSLAASWTASQDSGSGLAGYRYAIGSSPYLTDIRSWETLGDITSVTASGLTLTEASSCHFAVSAMDAAGNVGPICVSDGITVAPHVDAIGKAWAAPDQAPLAIRHKSVTASCAEAFWIEEADRSAAVKVMSTAVPEQGSCVSVAGVLGTSGGQRVLWGDVVHDEGPCLPVDPIWLRASHLGGAAVNALTPGTTGGTSLYNVGLLVRVCGRIIGAGSDGPAGNYILCDDGSSGASGRALKIRTVGLPPPPGAFVLVTGVVELEENAPSVVPTIRTRSEADVLPLD